MKALLLASNAALAAALPVPVVYVLAWPHELGHYLMARALGVPAVIHPGVTRHPATTPARHLAILMAPTVLGLLWLAWPDNGVLMLAVWWGTCAVDWCDAARVVRGMTGRVAW